MNSQHIHYHVRKTLCSHYWSKRIILLENKIADLSTELCALPVNCYISELDDLAQVLISLQYQGHLNLLVLKIPSKMAEEITSIHRFPKAIFISVSKIQDKASPKFFSRSGSIFGNRAVRLASPRPVFSNSAPVKSMIRKAAYCNCFYS